MLSPPQSAALQPISQSYSPPSSFPSVLGAQNVFLSFLMWHNSLFLTHCLSVPCSLGSSASFYIATPRTVMCIKQMIFNHCAAVAVKN